MGWIPSLFVVICCFLALFIGNAYFGDHHDQ